MIPPEAVEAAARVLLGYTGACVCHEGYTGRNLIDPDCRYHDVPPEVAKEILEAAASHMLAEAWQPGHTAGDGDQSAMWDARNAGKPAKYADIVTPNPYRSRK